MTFFVRGGDEGLFEEINRMAEASAALVEGWSDRPPSPRPGIHSAAAALVPRSVKLLDLERLDRAESLRLASAHGCGVGLPSDGTSCRNALRVHKATGGEYVEAMVMLVSWVVGFEGFVRRPDGALLMPTPGLAGAVLLAAELSSWRHEPGSGVPYALRVAIGYRRAHEVQLEVLRAYAAAVVG